MLQAISVALFNREIIKVLKTEQTHLPAIQLAKGDENILFHPDRWTG